jgi:hypothetical protein
MRLITGIRSEQLASTKDRKCGSNKPSLHNRPAAPVPIQEELYLIQV